MKFRMMYQTIRGAKIGDTKFYRTRDFQKMVSQILPDSRCFNNFSQPNLANREINRSA